ncbi:MAG: hypothetical protein AB1757_19980 [Acidobacteriota bacterium]
MILSGRNQRGLSKIEIVRCQQIWKFLCGNKKLELVIIAAHKHSSRTRFLENENRVYLGADVKPGSGIEANARMSIVACLAHELAHVQRFEMGFRRTFDFPDNLIDEAETSLHASCFTQIGIKDREDLIEDARDRLIQWLSETGRRSRNESGT